VAFGHVVPSSLFLAPGQSRTVEVFASTPSTPGDAAGSIVLTASGGGVDKYLGTERNSIAVTLRSLIDVARGGAFSGVLTGGNGRSPGEGQVNYYQFLVGPGNTSIMADLSLTNDRGDRVGSYLVAPDGNALGFGQNSLNGIPGLSQTAYTLDPIPGLWTLIVDFPSPIVGDEISQPFTGTIRLNQVRVSAPGLPNSKRTILPAGVPVFLPVTITNTGAAPARFFIDARLDTRTSFPLALLDPPDANLGCSCGGDRDPAGSVRLRLERSGPPRAADRRRQSGGIVRSERRDRDAGHLASRAGRARTVFAAGTLGVREDVADGDDEVVRSGGDQRDR